MKVAASGRHSEGETIKCIHAQRSSKQQSPEQLSRHEEEEKELWQRTIEDLSKAWRILRLSSPAMCPVVLCC